MDYRKQTVFYGWVVVASVCVILFLAFGSVYAFTTFFESFQAEFNASRSSISLVFAIAGFIYFSLGAISGQIADRMNSRWVIAFGVFVISLGLLCSSFAATVKQIYLFYGLGIGIGVGFTYVPAVGTVQRWFVAQRGLASGIAVMGIGLGTLGMPAFSAFLIHWSNWRTAYMVMSACVFGCGMIAVILIADSPKEMGLLPDGEPNKKADSIHLRKNIPEESQLAKGELTVKDVLKTHPFWLLYAGTFSASIGVFIPFVHLMPFSKDLGHTTSTGVFLLGLIGVGSTVGRFLMGGVADRFGRRRSLACMYAAMAAIFAWWLVSSRVWELALLAIIFGLCYGGFVALLPAVTADYFSGSNISGILGALYTSVACGNLLGPTFAGYMFDLRQSYVIPIVMSILSAIIAAICTLFLEKPESWRKTYFQ